MQPSNLLFILSDEDRRDVARKLTPALPLKIERTTKAGRWQRHFRNSGCIRKMGTSLRFSAFIYPLVTRLHYDRARKAAPCSAGLIAPARPKERQRDVIKRSRALAFGAGVAHPFATSLSFLGKRKASSLGRAPLPTRSSKAPSAQQVQKQAASFRPPEQELTI